MLTLLSFAGFLKTAFYVIIALLILLLMITIHEFGHYTFGKLLGFKINEFAIGFGKAIFKKTNKKTGEIFSVRILPLGGFCAFEGEEDESEDAGAFYKQKPWKRIIVLLGGVSFNFLSAIIFSIILLMVVGNPYSYQKVTSIYGNSLNSSAIEVGDVITHVNGTEISYWDIFNTQFSVQIGNCEVGENIKLTVLKSNGAVSQVDVQKYLVTKDNYRIGAENKLYNLNNVEDGVLGENQDKYETLGFTWQPVKVTNFFVAVGNSVLFTISLCWFVLVTIGMLFTGKLGIKNVGGPVTTIKVMAEVTSYSWQNVLYLIPLLATNLAVFNALPFPALDGSKVVFTGIEWIRRKPINRNVENIIHFAGLIILFAFVIIVDILHFIL